ncbi:MAG: ATP-binding cassette domain-containing protein [Spirochaetia bacterium]|nr:ATP-binding cassette domain-containing protein [Spirochaetia bacterium]
MNPIIYLKNISVVRDEKPILDNISLSIHNGENIAIIGSNGAGKSTLVGVMSELIHPIVKEETQRLLFGQQNWNIVELQKKMGIVSQSLQYLCNTSYSVEEIVLSGFFSSIGLDFHHIVTDEMKRRAHEVLKEYRMEYLKDNKMNTLSSGEARKALLMRASVHDPKVMLLDEVTTNLDLPSKKEYVSRLTMYANGGKTIILVTHDISQIIEEVRRVVVLKDGKIFADGSKEEVLTESVLSEAYSTKVFVSKREGRFNAWC